MDIIPLSVAARESTQDIGALRRSGKVPCVVYGNAVKNTTLTAEHNEIYKVYSKAGESTLVELTVDGKQVPVLFHELQFDPVSNRITHVDFYAVNMKKEVEADIPLHFVGKSPAVVDLGAIMVTGHDKVTVKCLPSDLPHALEVDISSMAQFGDHVTVANINVPKGVTVMDDPAVVVASVQEPRKEEEPVVAEVAEGATPVDGEAAPAAEGEAAEEKK